LYCRKRGFTLIELLIVVAIIAILALIAVPNFLEAQTRAKVSRIKADMRSLATALEAYYVDWNSYTNRNSESENPDSIGSDDPVGRFAGFGQLTTPIAYITTIPKDAFGRTRWVASAGGWRPAYFAMGTGDAVTRAPSGTPWSPGEGMPSNCWEIESDGPDHIDDTRDDYSTGNFPWPNAPRDNVVALIAPSTSGDFSRHGMLYDPTNGTVSRGEIMRFGGTKPGGAIYDFLWANAVK
jgi:prepilin-type N-terminal cleavage/methylation domain-containing protein